MFPTTYFCRRVPEVSAHKQCHLYKQWFPSSLHHKLPQNPEPPPRLTPAQGTLPQPLLSPIQLVGKLSSELPCFPEKKT